MYKCSYLALCGDHLSQKHRNVRDFVEKYQEMLLKHNYDGFVWWISLLLHMQNNNNNNLFITMWTNCYKNLLSLFYIIVHAEIKQSCESC